MTARIQCPACGVKLKLRSLDVLKRGVPCPGCQSTLPTSWPPEDEQLIAADLIEIIDEGAAESPDQSAASSARPETESAAATISPDVFLKVHSPNITLREYWWGNRNPLIDFPFLVDKIDFTRGLST